MQLRQKYPSSQPNSGSKPPAPVFSAATHEFLQTTLLEVFEEMDKAQEQSLHVLSTRQYDMFDLASKHKLPTSLRNDLLGHWYDAKTTVSQQFAGLKTTLTLRKQMAEVQFRLQDCGAPIPALVNARPTTGLDQDSFKQLNTMLAEFNRFRSLADTQTQKLKTVVLALNVKTQACKQERAYAKTLLEDLARSVNDQLLINNSREQLHQALSPESKELVSRGYSPY